MKINKEKKKRKRRFLLFIIITILIIAFVIGYKYKDELVYFYNDIFNKENKSINIDSIKKKLNIKLDPYLDFKNTTNFKNENLNRYLSYKEKNKSFDYEKVVNYVNIGLDYSFYSYIGNANMDKGILVLCNKYFKLPNGYEPSDLETISSEYFIGGNTSVRKLKKEAREQFEKLSAASIKNGTPVYGQSGFRPYSMQTSLYNSAVASMGKSAADNDTARPGHSEHQTGLAIDVSSTKSGNMLSFEKTSSFTWMQNNAYKYGFILRYQKNKTNITGFMYESWHYRYVGIKVATDMHDNYSGLTYEEYYYKFIDNK